MSSAVPPDGTPSPSPTPGAAPAGDLAVEVVEDAAGFDALREEWNAAAAASADPNVFLTWEWLRTWWRHFGEPREPRETHDPDWPREPDDDDRGGGIDDLGEVATTTRLHVVVVRDGDGIVAAVPLQRSRLGAGLLRSTVLRPISFDVGDYGGILLVRRHGDAVDVLIDHLAGQLGDDADTADTADAVVLSRLATGSTLLAELRRALRATASGRELVAYEADLGDACPYADVRKGYDLRRHAGRHDVRQRMRRLSQQHGVAFVRHTGPALDDGLERLLDVHRARGAERAGGPPGLLAGGRHEAFLLDAVRALDAAGRLRLSTLLADGRTVAAELDFELARRVFVFESAFDPAFAELGPGQLLTYRVLEEGIAEGVEEFDFLRGDHPDKRRWSNGERRLVTVTLTHRGLQGRLADQRTRRDRALDARIARVARRRGQGSQGPQGPHGPHGPGGRPGGAPSP